ncbi:unnamed protein product [Euphydryas editha]|uniref:Uncharacterized protein n=1 Tax=Euphydryas editha TaxID=104508 RepID=A0AAU9TDL4_EUPED|nr:unnamed protein product [Euphydryas editha]
MCLHPRFFGNLCFTQRAPIIASYADFHRTMCYFALRAAHSSAHAYLFLLHTPPLCMFLLMHALAETSLLVLVLTPYCLHLLTLPFPPNMLTPLNLAHMLTVNACTYWNLFMPRTAVDRYLDV